MLSQKHPISSARERLWPSRKMQGKSLDKFFENKFFEGIYAHLTPKQSDIIDAVYRHNMDLKKYSEEQNISYTAAYQLKNRALGILKNVVTYE